MTVYGNSTFIAPNQSGWISSDGQTWTHVRGNQVLSISGNEGLMTYNGSTTAGIVQLGSTLVGDGEYLVRCSQSASTADEMGICVRFKDTNNHYKFSQGATAGQFQLIKDVSTVFTVIAGTGFTSVVGTFYWIRARVVGTSFFGKIWQDGTPEPSTWTIGAAGVTDSALPNPGGFGLVGAPRTGDHVSFDSFFAFDYINSEDLVVSDSFSGTSTPVLVDGLSVSDSLQANSAFNPTDSLSVSDSFLAQSGANWTEIVPVADSFLAGGIYQPVDSLSISDSFSGTGTFAPVEAISASESFSATEIANFLEALVIRDSFTGISQSPPILNATVIVPSGQGSILIPTGQGTVIVPGN